MRDRKIQVDGELREEFTEAEYIIRGETTDGRSICFAVDAVSPESALKEARKRCILSNMTAERS